MPLTPEDVSKKRFTPVRLREGYDMGEVDTFLDEVEAELERLLKENDDLRSKLTATDGGTAAIAMPGKAPEQATEQAPEQAPEKAPEKAPRRRRSRRSRLRRSEKVEAEKPAAVAAPDRGDQGLHGRRGVLGSHPTAGARHPQRRRGRDRGHRRRPSRSSAPPAPRPSASRRETKSKTDKLEQEARSRAQNLDSEIDAKRREMLGDLEREKRRLDTEVEDLRGFEREYRSRLKSYFTEQLEALDGSGEGGGQLSDGGSASPKRLKSVSDDPANRAEPGANEDENQASNQGGPDEPPGLSSSGPRGLRHYRTQQQGCRASARHPCFVVLARSQIR